MMYEKSCGKLPQLCPENKKIPGSFRRRVM
jgi:hypothetical protein